jgi:ATP-dependent helicase/nuclease subunit A
MKERLGTSLYWLSSVVANDDNVVAQLTSLLDRPPELQEIKRSRELYHKFIQVNSVRIGTIHSFCMDILNVFSFALGMFDEINIVQGEELLKTIQSIQNEGLACKQDGMFMRNFSCLSKYWSFEKISDVLSELVAKRYEFARFMQKYIEPVGAGAVDATAPPITTKHYGDFLRTKLLEDYAPAAKFDEQVVANIAQAIVQGCALLKSDVAFFDNIQAKQYCNAFFTTTQTIRKKLVTKGIQAAYPNLVAILHEQAEALYREKQRESVEALIAKTQAVIELGDVIIQKYQEHKKNINCYDFEDLIILANSLLSKALLDEDLKNEIFKQFPIRHIFLDEAQDTSPQQWQLLIKLVEAFFTPQSSLFVVGDVKQSIYSFQGARPWLFCSLAPVFQKTIENSGGTWKKFALTKSYRTAPAILEIVDKIFENDGAGVVFDEGYNGHTSNRKNPGWVRTINVDEIAAEVKAEVAGVEGAAAPAAEPEMAEDAASNTLIDNLSSATAAAVQEFLTQKVFLSSVQRTVTAEDILILTRQRGPLQNAIIEKINALNISVAGADVIKASEHLIWKDLVAFVRFLIFPQDDYNTACLLKSPFFRGISEETLFTLCFERKQHLYRSELIQESRLKAYADEFKNCATAADIFDFLARVLASVQTSFYERFGDITDTIFDAFLQGNYTFLQKNGVNPQKLLRFLESTSCRVKNPNVQKGVRFMTVHGAKGLQAPVVFIVDQSYNRLLQKEVFVWFPDGECEGKSKNTEEHENKSKGGMVSEECLLLMPYDAFATIPALQLREMRQRQLIEENRRLLYVAMTRAQDGLFSIGQYGDDGWHRLIADHAKDLYGSYDRRPEDGAAQQSYDGNGGATTDSMQKIVRLRDDFVNKVLVPIPPKQERETRGILIHHFIEKIAAEDFDESNFLAMLLDKAKALGIASSAVYAINWHEILRIRSKSEFFWIKNGWHECSLCSRGKLFRVDHLYVDNEKVVIIEVKTSEANITRLDEIKREYIEQLSQYYHLAADIFKGKQIMAYFLLTQTQSFIKLI